MLIGDRVRRECLNTGDVVFVDIKTQKQLDYYKGFDKGFKITVIPVAQDSTCIACEG